MVARFTGANKPERFVAPPWTTESEEWQALDRRLPPQHVARRIAKAVETLNLEPLRSSYLGAGKKALPPELLLKLVLYEIHCQRPSPAQWTRDARESEPVRWLLFGLEPSRARLYDFRDRLAKFLPDWNEEVLRAALERGVTRASRVALDSSSVAAHASRRQLLNEERLQQRRRAIDDRLQHLRKGETATSKAAWLARTEIGLRQQKHRYARAWNILQERQRINSQRRSAKRKPADKILVSPTDPDAILSRDKLNVFRPLYTVQLLRDLDSPLILSYDVLTQSNDNGVLEPMIDRMAQSVGRKPAVVLVDSGYVSMQHLEFCELAGITLYGPCQENDFSVHNGKQAQRNQHTELPKSAFQWLAEEQCYRCPEGRRLDFRKTQTQRRADHTITLSIYGCAPEHCQTCPRQSACTRTPQKGRSVSRLPNEALLDALRERMRTPDAKRFYKLRSQTVELSYADLKEHRGLRRFHARSLPRVTAEIASQVLTHNLVELANSARQRVPVTEPPQTLCAA